MREDVSWCQTTPIGRDETRRFVPVDDGDRVVAWISDWLAEGGRVLLMTDYDGTLTPIVGDPAEAWLPDRVKRDLQTLAHSWQCRVALISGRDLEDLRARAPLAGTIYAGCHGLEVVGPDFSFCHPEAEAQRPVLEAVSRALMARAPGIEGMRVEPKRLAVAIHYRDVPTAARHELEAELARAIQQEGARLSIFHGVKVIEVLPQVNWNKGTCAMWIYDWARRRLQAPMLTVYLGDDWTDEHAFEALAGLAITVRVGAQPPTSRATYRLNDVARVHQLLASMASIVGPRRDP
jgi:trehalose-phosphatase